MSTLTRQQLVEGHWYKLDDGKTAFELVAIDDTGHCLEVQFYDGTIGELGLTSALLSGIHRCASPVDLSGALDDHRDCAVLPNKDEGLRRGSLLDQLDSEIPQYDVFAREEAVDIEAWNKEWA